MSVVGPRRIFLSCCFQSRFLKRSAAEQQRASAHIYIHCHFEPFSIAVLQLVFDCSCWSFAVASDMAASRSFTERCMDVFKRPVADVPAELAPAPADAGSPAELAPAPTDASPSPSATPSPVSIDSSLISMGSATPVAVPAAPPSPASSISYSSESEEEEAAPAQARDADLESAIKHKELKIGILPEEAAPAQAADLESAIKHKELKIGILIKNRAKLNKQIQKHRKDLRTLQAAQSISLRLKTRRRLTSKTTVPFSDSSDEEAPVRKRPAHNSKA